MYLYRAVLQKMVKYLTNKFCVIWKAFNLISIYYPAQSKETFQEKCQGIELLILSQVMKVDIKVYVDMLEMQLVE